VTLAWFVAEAMELARLPADAWDKDMTFEERTRILEAWQAHVGAKVDFVKLAKLRRVVIPFAHPVVTKPPNDPCSSD
jgi:hypothetical protein